MELEKKGNPMNYKISYGLLVVFAFTGCKIQAECTATTKKEIENYAIHTPNKLYLAIQQKFIPVMGSNFFDQKFIDLWTQWSEYTQCVNTFIDSKLIGYEKNISKIENAIALINGIVATKGKLPQSIIASKKNELAKTETVLKGVFKFALNQVSEIDRPDSWKKDVRLSTPEKILPGYKQFFKNYSNLAIRYNGVVDFLVAQKKITNSKDIKSITNFADALEQLSFLFEEESKKSGWNLFGNSKADLQRMIASCENIIQELLYNYPSIITWLTYLKIDASKNFAALSLLAQADDLLELIKKLKNFKINMGEKK